MSRALQFVLCMLPALLTGAAPNPADYVRLLIPISSQGSTGAGGSFWFTDFQAYNANDFFVEVSAAPHETCMIVCPAPILEPRSTGSTHPNSIHRFGGGFLYVEREGFENIHFSLRGRETSQDMYDVGFTLPIVVRDEIEPGAPSIIVNVYPVREGNRSLLRIYDLEAREIQVRVKFLSRENELHYETVVTLLVDPDRPGRGNRSADFPAAPSSATLRLEDLPLPPPVDIQHPSQLRGGFRIEMEPADPESRIWGFLTITTQDTHRVSVLEPQP